jgi:hypothetical protein
MSSEIMLPWKMRTEKSYRRLMGFCVVFFLFLPLFMFAVDFFRIGDFGKMELNDYLIIELFAFPLALIGVLRMSQYVECFDEGIKIFDPVNGRSKSVSWNEIEKVTIKNDVGATTQGVMLPYKKILIESFDRKNISVVLGIYSESDILSLLEVISSRARGAQINVNQEKVKRYYRQTFWDYVKKLGG